MIISSRSRRPAVSRRIFCAGRRSTCVAREPRPSSGGLAYAQLLLTFAVVLVLSAPPIPFDDADVLSSLAAGAERIEKDGKSLFRVGGTNIPLMGSDLCGAEDDAVC